MGGEVERQHLTDEDRESNLKLCGYLEQAEFKSILVLRTLKLGSNEVSLKVGDYKTDGYACRNDMDRTVGERDTSRRPSQDLGRFISLDNR